MERVLADSANRVLREAIRAISDEGIGIRLVDERRGIVESEFVDVAAVRATIDTAGLARQDRLVKFQFRTQPTFGGTRLVAEALYRPFRQSVRQMERMVGPDHPGRAVLSDMLQRIEERLRER